LIPKIYKNPISKEFNMLKAAKRLTLPTSGKTLIFDGETDMNACADFWIHEFRTGGATMIERCDASQMGLEPIEAEMLEAHRRSRTSLFEAVETRPREHQVLLVDLLEPQHGEICLTDMGLSGSLAQHKIRLLLFFRLVSARGVHMTSGVSFVFRPNAKRGCSTPTANA